MDNLQEIIWVTAHPYYYTIHGTCQGMIRLIGYFFIGGRQGMNHREWKNWVKWGVINSTHSINKESRNMANIRRLVLDTLKPHEPNIIELAQVLGSLEGISAVNISIYELDRKVENAKITIEGEAISYTNVSMAIEEMGGTIHSIDEVVAGKQIIDDAVTLQD
jgi:hypothetical protein